MDSPTISRILVAVDGSPQSQEACRMAIGLAHNYEATLTALHVAMPIDPGRSVSPTDYIRVHAAATNQGAAVLRVVRDLARGWIQFTAEQDFGDPAATICRRAEELDADLIVLGSRGLGRLDRLMLGSVSSAVVKRAPCSVLVVR